MANLKEKALEQQYVLISEFCRSYYCNFNNLSLEKSDELTNLVASKFKVTKIEAEKFKVRYLKEHSLTFYLVKNFEALLPVATNYAETLKAKNIALDEKFYDKFLSKLKNEPKTQDELYKAFFIYLFLSKNDYN